MTDKIYNVVFSTQSISDLTEIRTFIESYTLSREYAKKIINFILDSCESLEFFPYRFPYHESLRKLEIRKMTVDSYYVIYKVLDENSMVEIITIKCSKQLLPDNNHDNQIN